jgi:hypothetical protein
VNPPRVLLRRAWREHITIEDYERHMAAIGQAQANAALLEELFRNFAPRLGAQILFAGAGTGQCFDYLPPNLLGRHRSTFSDINPGYLAGLSERIHGAEISTVIDDVEDSQLAGPYDLSIAVLVLEHVDWRQAVHSLTRQAARVFVVIQQNPPEPTPNRLQGTLSILGEAPPARIDPDALTAALEGRSYRLLRTSRRAVQDGKTMLALDFVR